MTALLHNKYSVLFSFSNQFLHPLLFSLLLIPPENGWWGLSRQPWPEQLQRFQTTQDMFSDDGELLSRGLPAKISVFSGDITKVCPHTVTGRADYFGSVVNRSARLLAGAQAGQVLLTFHIPPPPPPGTPTLLQQMLHSGHG